MWILPTEDFFPAPLCNVGDENKVWFKSQVLRSEVKITVEQCKLNKVKKTSVNEWKIKATKQQWYFVNMNKAFFIILFLCKQDKKSGNF